MKMNRFSQIGLTIGTTLTISSWFRYFVLYPDMDKAIVYGIVGFLIISVSWLYDMVRNLQNTLYSVEEFIQDRLTEDKK